MSIVERSVAEWIKRHEILASCLSHFFSSYRHEQYSGTVSNSGPNRCISEASDVSLPV